MILDGIDGPAARAWAVSEHVPRIDGYTLDLIIDFVTCIVIPVIFLHQFDMLPDGASLYIGAFMLSISALWMSRTDQMTAGPLVQRLPVRVEHDRADAVPARRVEVGRRRRVHLPHAHAADQLEVRPPDAGPPLPARSR